MKKIIGLFIFLFIGFSSLSQIEMPSDKVEWNFSVEQDGCNAVVVGKLKIDEGWHIYALKLKEGSYSIPTTFNVHESPSYKLVGEVYGTKPIEKYVEFSGETQRLLEGSVVLKQKIKITSKEDFELQLDFGFQTCDSVHCLFPFQETFTVDVKGCISTESDENNTFESGLEKTNEKKQGTVISKDTTEFSGSQHIESSGLSSNVLEKNQSVTATKNTADSSENKVEEQSLWGLFWLAFGFGLLALLTPCVFPMIPLTVSFFTKQSKTKTKGIANAIKYGVAIVLIYVILGTAVSAIFGAESLNTLSTSPTLNIIFFVVFVIFAVSFLGAFEIQLPSSWANKSDEKADKGGLLGIFFMALALAIVSFSCTGPIVGLVLVQSATTGIGMGPIVGMLGFSLALALPFALFAAFPSWLNSLPKSGGWMNTVKVVLGLLELAFAFKFLSNADLTLQAHLLEREVFIAIWIGIFIVLALYLFGAIRFPNDSKVEKISVGRAMFGTFVISFVIYLIPGMWGAPLELLSGFPPPKSYSESPLGVGKEIQSNNQGAIPLKVVEGMTRGPQGIMVFEDYDKALQYAQKVDKPLFVDFTGWACVNCRKMEEEVWGKPGVIQILRDSVVIASLHVDERSPLPKEEQITVTYPNGRKKTLKTVGDKWQYMEITQYKTASQPYYIMQNGKGEDLSNGSASYMTHSDPKKFLNWLQEGMREYRFQLTTND